MLVFCIAKDLILELLLFKNINSEAFIDFHILEEFISILNFGISLIFLTTSNHLIKKKSYSYENSCSYLFFILYNTL